MSQDPFDNWERLRKLLPNLESMKRSDQLKALRRELLEQRSLADRWTKESRRAEGFREEALRDCALVLAEISARENGR